MNRRATINLCGRSENTKSQRMIRMSTVFENIFGQKTGHPVLFKELCAHLELDKKACKVLNQIVSKLNLDKPAMIFVDPAILRSGAKLPEVADSIELLRELYYKWFGGAI